MREMAKTFSKLTARGVAAIAQSIARGDLAPIVGSDIVAVIANVGRLRETDLLEARLQALEERLGGNQS